MLCWHNWTDWEQYTEEVKRQQHPFAKEMLPYAEERQKRYCVHCGKKQDQKVRTD